MSPQLLQDVKNLYSTPGEFADGEIVKQGSNLGEKRIRSDRVTWVDEQYTECEGVRYLCKQMDKYVHLCSRLGHCRILNRTKVNNMFIYCFLLAVSVACVNIKINKARPFLEFYY